MHYGGSIWEDSKQPGPNLEKALDEAHAILAEPEKVPSDQARPGNAMLVEPYRIRARRILCQQFSIKIINAFSPHVEFFKNWKNHSFGRHFSFLYSPIEGLLNKFLRYVMKKKILPSVMASAIEEGIDATAKHNLPFSIALTDFVSSKISELDDMIDKPAANTSNVTLFPPPSIPNLNKFVEALLPVLDQVSLKPEDFKLKQKPKAFNPDLQKEIEAAIVDNSKLLFQYLAQPQNAEALFAQLFQISNSAFSNNAERIDYNKQKIQLEKRIKELKKDAKHVFKKMVLKSVNDKIKGQPEQAKEKAELAFHDEKQEAIEAFSQLKDLSQSMVARLRDDKEEEVDLSSQSTVVRPLPDNKEVDLQAEIASCRSPGRDRFYGADSEVFCHPGRYLPRSRRS